MATGMGSIFRFMEFGIGSTSCGVATEMRSMLFIALLLVVSWWPGYEIYSGSVLPSSWGIHTLARWSLRRLFFRGVFQ